MPLAAGDKLGGASWNLLREDPDRYIYHAVGHGMAMCRKTDGRWRILNMHNSVHEP